MAHPELAAAAQEITELCKKYRVQELSVFGSACRSDFRPDSDFDFLVEFEPDVQVGFLTLAALSRELSEVLHRKVDLVPKRGLKERIRDEVLASAEVLYAA